MVNEDDTERIIKAGIEISFSRKIIALICCYIAILTLFLWFCSEMDNIILLIITLIHSCFILFYIFRIRYNLLT